MSMEWVERKVNTNLANKLMDEIDISYLTSKLLATKGIKNAEQVVSFLKPNFKKELHNPFLLMDIEKVVKRIAEAILKQQKVIIHGDYDADGVTTATVYVKSLEKLGLKVDYFLPNRFKDGYGVNPKNVPMLAEYDLIITGDTGIKHYDAVYELTHTYHKDVIVTDHHEPVVYPQKDKERLAKNTKIVENEKEVMAIPDCYAVINPKRIDCKYPSKDLSGAGVAFKVMEAVFDYLKKPKRELYELLDVVACGLVPDMVPLFNVENNTFEVRCMIKIGLSLMNSNPKAWVEAVQSTKNKPREITSTDLGFTYGPLLNATGRLYDPTPALEFLLEEDYEKVQEMYQDLNRINLERRKLSADASSEILKELKDMPEDFRDYGIVAYHDKIHVGITGLVAGDILKEYYRTTIALSPFETEEGLVYKGSARSIEGISVLEALIDVEKEIGFYIYGGHEQAAGLTLKPEQLEPFRKAFRLAIKKQADAIGPEVFVPKKFYDLKIKFNEVNFQFLNELQELQPFGMGNEEPTFCAENVLINKINIIADKETGKEKGLRFTFVQDGTVMEGIIWSKVKDILKTYEESLKKSSKVFVDMLGFPQINDYSGRFQFSVKEMKFK